MHFIGRGTSKFLVVTSLKTHSAKYVLLVKSGEKLLTKSSSLRDYINFFLIEKDSNVFYFNCTQLLSYNVLKIEGKMPHSNIQNAEVSSFFTAASQF